MIGQPTEIPSAKMSNVLYPLELYELEAGADTIGRLSESMDQTLAVSSLATEADTSISQWPSVHSLFGGSAKIKTVSWGTAQTSHRRLLPSEARSVMAGPMLEPVDGELQLSREALRRPDMVDQRCLLACDYSGKEWISFTGSHYRDVSLSSTPVGSITAHVAHQVVPILELNSHDIERKICCTAFLLS